jgi:tetratricopeptide (TPR) repeat protein
LSAAQQCYDDVLSFAPACADAWNLKGAALVDQGRPNEAVSLFDRAIALLPQFPDVHFNKGNALAALGNNEGALNAYAQAIALNSRFADARANAGTLLERLGRHEEAIATFQEMTLACPDDYRGFLNLGICLEKRLATPPDAETAREARTALERALALAPHDADVHYALGMLYSRLGDRVNAIARVASALESPSRWTAARRAEVLSALGEIYRKTGQIAEAVARQKAAFDLNREDLNIRYCLANTLRDAGEPDAAERHYLELIDAYPSFLPSYINLGNVYRDRGDTDAAGTMFERALARNPSYAAAYANLAALCVNEGWFRTGLLLHDKASALGTNDAGTRFKRAISLLLLGRLREGWQGYDERYEAPEENVSRRASPPRYWQGDDLHGKSLLIWTEQGLGDEILHGSMIPDVLKNASHLAIECSRRIAPVFARSFPGAKVLGLDHRQTVGSRVEHYDYQTSIASLGRYLRPDFESFPKHAGYLRADSAKLDRLRGTYVKQAAGRRIVGLSWRSRNARLGPNKSARLLNFKPLLQTPGVMFVNLQYGDCAAEIAEAREKLGVEIVQDSEVDPVADIDAFFAQVAAMDLVITTSNTTAHVAGAQNIPVWVLLPYTKGTLWYWFFDRNDSPWYPSARLIRATRFRSSEPWEIEAAERATRELTCGMS